MPQRLIAIGDIHGCFKSFRTLCEKKLKIEKADKIVLLGDYIDRGRDSKAVVDYIIDLKESGYDIIPLIGNHEDMLLNAYFSDENTPLLLWLQNRGGTTLKSFGIDSVKGLERRYMDFFRHLYDYYEYENYLFVHAGFNSMLENPFEDKNAMVWSRAESFDHPMLKDRVIVHGHTPIPAEVCKKQVKSGSKVINVDTGCVYGRIFGLGKLSAVELFSRKLFVV